MTHGHGESEMLGMEMDLWANSKAGNSRPVLVIFSQETYLKMIIKLENDAGITPLFLNVSHIDRSPFFVPLSIHDLFCSVLVFLQPSHFSLSLYVSALQALEESK